MSLQDDLVNLFKLDKQVRDLRAGLDAAQNRLKVQEDRLERAQEKRDELEQQSKQVRAEAADLEGQAEQIEEHIEEQREKMNQATNNKEYSALLVEVNTQKIDKERLEEEALQKLTRADELKEELEAAEQAVTDQEQLVESAEQDVKERKDAIGDRLETLTAERDEAAEKIPEDVLAIFQKLANDYEGESMAGITEHNRRRMEYHCGGCHLSLPVERVSAVMSQTEEITQCPSCNRILFLDPELKAEMTG
ncbi:MAG: C4-type zinc ribbon domain-containing protein [Phycisphaeraceae bacterium]|nr:C4-type zinc ribbon domain-containing protein [Phycisphaeraceae bacterium]